MTYTFFCNSCEKIVDIDCPMDERNNSYNCECGEELVRYYEGHPHYWCETEWPGGWKNEGGGQGDGH